jgi:ATP-dependent Clp protease adaptor protein ClpS
MSTNTDISKVKKKQKSAVKPPPFYQVLMHNDDFTTTDFVVDVLQRFFSFDVERAVALMLKVHHEGQAVCGVYTRDIAMTKVDLVRDYARQHEYPLRCSCEPV